MAKGEQDWYISGVFNMSFIVLNDTFGDYVDRGNLGLKITETEDGIIYTDMKPDSHVLRHQNGGVDEIVVDNLSGVLADKQDPQDHGARHKDGGIDELDVAELAGAKGSADQVPKTDGDAVSWDEVDHNELTGVGTDNHHAQNHAARHQDGGADEMSVASLSGVLADKQDPQNHADRHKDGGIDELDLVELAGALGTLSQVPKTDGDAVSWGNVDHSELTGVGTSDHHVKTGDNEVYGLILSDTIANRPAAGIAERYFFATDEGILYYDDGAAWNKAAVNDHGDLDGIGTDDHHAKYTDSEAVDAVNSESTLSVDISGDAQTLAGFPIDESNIGEPCSTIAHIAFNSVMEVGKYIDFHIFGSTVDYDVRVECVDTDTLDIGGILTQSGDNVATEIWVDNNYRAKENLLYIEDQKASGTDGGTFDSGAWRTRDLNTVLTNDISGASLSGNVITLPAGTFEIECDAPGSNYAHMARLYDMTNSVLLLVGTSEYSQNHIITKSVMFGSVTLSGSTTIEVQHKISDSQPDDGFGRACGMYFSVDHETYTRIKIRKVK